MTNTFEKNIYIYLFSMKVVGSNRSTFLGPMMRLLALRESELPDPMVRWMQTADPDCEEEEEGVEDYEATDEDSEDKKRAGRGRNGRRRVKQKNKAQNDMAPVEAEPEPEQELGIPVAEDQPPAPVQEESRVYGSAAVTTPAALTFLITLCLVLLHVHPL